MPVNREKEMLALDALESGLLEVRSDGSVWRVQTKGRTGRLRPIAPVRADRARDDGYRYVSISKNGKEFRVFVHRLVWLASGQPIPDGHDINHKDGNRGHNDLANLEPLTPGDNLAHAYRELGRQRPVGERNKRGRLARDQVRSIHVLHSDGVGQREIARRFGVTHRAVRMIITGQSWRDEYPAVAS